MSLVNPGADEQITIGAEHRVEPSYERGRWSSLVVFHA